MMSEKNMPLYWENHLKEKIARIHELQAKGGNGCVSVGFLSDVHWRTNLLGSVGALERVLNDCSIPYYFNGGDTVSGCGIGVEQRSVNGKRSVYGYKVNRTAVGCAVLSER